MILLFHTISSMYLEFFGDHRLSKPELNYIFTFFLHIFPLIILLQSLCWAELVRDTHWNDRMIWLEHVYPWVKSMKWVLKFMHINSFPPYFIFFLVPISLFRKPFTILQLKKGSSCNREGEARAASSEEELKGKYSVPSTNICFF